MSDVIRLSLKSGNLKIKVNNDADAGLNEDQQEDYFDHQLQSQYEKGFIDGQNQLRAELENEYLMQLSEKTEEFNRILGMLEANLSEYDQAYDKIVIEAAVAIAEKIIKQQISKQSIITDTLRESVKKIIGANEILIRVNPADHNEIHSGHGTPLLEESFSKIKFEIDEKLEPGGCMVETEIGNVDARISTQINEIKKQLEASFLSQSV
ncbi:MAG: FliH/SctL family protein [Bacillota bacterium]